MPVAGHITLSELAGHIKSVISQSFHQKAYWVLADVIDHKFYAQKGCHYFSLAEKDPEGKGLKAKLSAIAWSDGGAISIESFERKTGQRFKSDIHVLVNVSLAYHATYGLQLVLNDIDTTYTIGMLEQQRRSTLDDLVRLCPDYIRLVGEKYQTRNNCLAHAKVIQKVAVVTSSNAAGYKDFRDTIESNRFGYRVRLDNYFVAVQGEANADAVCNKLIEIYRTGIAYDAVVVIRGGGSQSDLIIFEQFKLARAVAKFPIPIISGIGHHINETIVDLMCHTSVKTPSIAAEFIISHNKAFEDSVLLFQKSIVIKSQQLFAARQNRLQQLNLAIINNSRNIIQVAKDNIVQQCQSAINDSRVLLFNRRISLGEDCNSIINRPKLIVASKKIELTAIVPSIKAFSKSYFKHTRGYLQFHLEMRTAHDPINVLKRGFAVITHRGKVITNTDGVQPLEEVKIRMSESELTTIIKSKTEKNGSKIDL